MELFIQTEKSKIHDCILSQDSKQERSTLHGCAGAFGPRLPVISQTPKSEHPHEAGENSK